MGNARPPLPVHKEVAFEFYTVGPSNVLRRGNGDIYRRSTRNETAKIAGGKLATFTLDELYVTRGHERAERNTPSRESPRH